MSPSRGGTTTNAAPQRAAAPMKPIAGADSPLIELTKPGNRLATEPRK
jgi:hypothetical protein